MKILVVSQYYYPEPFRITDMCETLVKRGHSVTVVTAQPNYPDGKIYTDYVNKYQESYINGVNIKRSKIYPRGKGAICLFLNYISFPFYARKIIKKIDKDFDVVFINQLSPIFSALPGIRYSKKNKIKSILYCLDLWPESITSSGISENSFIYKLIFMISTNIYKRVDRILVTSKSFIDKFNKIKLNAVYLPQYAEDLFINLPCNKKSNEYFVVTFAGNIGEIQSVETILLAAKELLIYEDIVINIYGSGSKFDFIYNLKVSLSLDNVILHGRKAIEEMPLVYSNSDALIVTLKKNKLLSLTLPGKVQTYMASGKPIIAAINGETKNIIEESKAGYVCNAEDYLQLSKLIIDARSNEYLFQMGKNGKEYYEKNFTKKVFFERLEAEFMEVKNVYK
ncbi:MAG: glycosyltransferase WbuB [Tenericutes bacterium HGW-Tenericutes-1]|jgi:glycosyltransferase involved in cell wall biosynthesis|nr:MAG: glycosyltransferase WbuB [Tenericutes bacterium HGW-Tenericutes-1]